ncbi:TonB-dependent receptor [uncultured Chitinophaga sp.]|uniref:TonB-dependent receptor n=1 Tax=uncultured Chitinophaga sp. TaxID=339340 RepID=UPI0025D56A47|nr:TonB-dependent receptor [uncultured Chitinophaga sp.]
MNYTRLLAMCLLFILPFSLFANENPPSGQDNTLSGTVTDKSDQSPLPGATIYFPDLKIGAVADAQGKYSVKHLPQGRFLVEVRYIGHAAITNQLVIKGNTTMDFVLGVSVTEQNEVVVTGVNVATQLRQNPTPISIVRKDYLDRTVSSNLVDAISQLPGISQVSTGPAISKPVIRGLGYNRVVVVNDEVRQEGQQWGDEHGLEVDDYNVNKIEILKGPASLMYGSDALAGVVNIISDMPVPMGTIRGGIDANYQSNNGMFGYHANIAGNQNGFNWKLYGTQKLAHDYKNKYDDYVLNSKFRNTNYGAGIGLNKSWGYSRLSFSSYSLEPGLVEGERDENGKFIKPVNDNGSVEEVAADNGDFKSYHPLFPKQKIDHQKLIWDNNLYLSNGARLGVNLGYQVNKRREFEDVLAPDEVALYFKLKTFNYGLKYFFADMNGWQTTVGVNGMQQQNSNHGAEFLIPSYSLFDAGVFALTRKSFGKLTIAGGLRSDYRNIKSDALYLDEDEKPVSNPVTNGVTRFESFERDFSNVSGSVGLSYAPIDQLTLKLNVARGFRSPNIAELSANGVHEGTIRYEYGNTGLDAEVSTQVDAGLEVNTEHVSFGVNAFYNNISNYIYSRKLLGADGTDSIPATENEDGYAAFKYQQGRAYLYGGELTIDIHPHPIHWLHFENSISWVEARLANGNDSTKYLPAIPPLRWLSELRGDFRKNGKGIRNVYAKVQLDKLFDQKNVYSAYNTETVTGGYALLNAGVGAEFVNKSNKTLFALHVAANNITDEAYQNHLNRLKYAGENVITGRTGVFGMGRNFSVKVSVPLEFR